MVSVPVRIPGLRTTTSTAASAHSAVMANSIPGSSSSSRLLTFHVSATRPLRLKGAKPGVVRRAMCILIRGGDVIPYPYAMPLRSNGCVDGKALEAMEDHLVAVYGESDA